MKEQLGSDAETPGCADMRTGKSALTGCGKFGRYLEIPQEVATNRADNFGDRLAFSVEESAKLLGISEKSVRRLIDRGLLRASRALRHLLISKKEIERFLERTTSQ